MEDRETVELPSPGDAIPNGHHLPSSEDRDGVEPPAPEPVVASAIELQRNSPLTWQEKISDKLPSLLAAAGGGPAGCWNLYKPACGMPDPGGPLFWAAMSFPAKLHRGVALTFVAAR